MESIEIRKHGYGRVSSRDQSEQPQLDSLKAIGIHERDIYIDKQSGKNFHRPEYQQMKHSLGRGGILYIHSLDRFGRDKEEILNEWKDITKNIVAYIVVLDMPLLDTTKYRDSLGTFISDLVLQILSWVAEDERDRIKKRKREGINSALQNGVKFGRPSVEITESFVKADGEWKAGNISATEAVAKADMKRRASEELCGGLQNSKTRLRQNANF